jgi:hypothetical protein
VSIPADEFQLKELNCHCYKMGLVMTWSFWTGVSLVSVYLIGLVCGFIFHVLCGGVVSCVLSKVYWSELSATEFVAICYPFLLRCSVGLNCLSGGVRVKHSAGRGPRPPAPSFNQCQTLSPCATLP